MKFSTNNGFLKQTALQLLCGLLPCLCFAQQRSVSDAYKIANGFVQDNSMRLRASSISMKLSSSIISAEGGLRADRESYYIFTSASDVTGFVIVSGDERMPDILAYSDENNFDTDNIPPNVRYWLDCYEEAFSTLNSSDNPKTKGIESVNPDGVAPLLESNAWGQGDPYNRLCPSVRNVKCVTGCVATAMAQVMNFHRYPDTGKGSVNYTTETNRIKLQRDFSSVQFHWDKMLDAYRKNYTQEEADAVAELMYACGTSVKMDYCTSEQGGSGAFQTDLIIAFVDNFKYDNDAAFMDRRYCSIDDWHQFIINELNAGRPINYAGQSMRDGGHSFVFDGYKMNPGGNYPYYHVNWGWNGSCDGYYQITDLHPSEDGQHATYDAFNSSQQMTINIKPEDGVNDGKIYLGTPNLYVSSSTSKAGSKITAYTASCTNFSYKPFNGTLYVALISVEDSSMTILGGNRMKSLSYLQDQNNLSIDITIPTSIADGQYKIQLLAKETGNNNYLQVFSKQYPILTISSSGNVSPEVTNEAMLGCSEIEAVTNSDPSLISINIYELQNLLDVPFIGDLKMILADKGGKQLCSFGDSIQPGELSTFEVQEEPLKIKGKLMGEWPDGDYKLYVGARQINTSKFVYLSYYDIAKPDMAYHDLSLKAQIKDGRLIINGKTYDILPTSLDYINSENILGNSSHIRIYNLNGICIGNIININVLPQGMYFIIDGGHRRKVFINR